MYFLVHPGVEHDRSAGVDDLKCCTGGHEDFIAATVNYRRVRSVTLRHLRNIDSDGRKQNMLTLRRERQSE